MRLIQLLHKTTADYHWLQSQLNQTPRMDMVTQNSKPLANTVSNHHPCFQISSLYKHFFSSFPFSWILRTKLLSQHGTLIYTTFMSRRSQRQFNDWSTGERGGKKKKINNQWSLEKSWGMQCFELKHWWVSSSSCNSSLCDTLRVSPTESWGGTQCSSAQPFTRGKWEAEADSASLSHAEKGVKSKAEGKKKCRQTLLYKWQKAGKCIISF